VRSAKCVCLSMELVEHSDDERPTHQSPEPAGAEYSWLETYELIKLYKDRGFGDVREIMINALVEQDLQHAERPFPFMSLPAELRTMVYSYAMPEGDHNFRDFLPVLTQVSSQVRKESLEFLFDSNAIELEAQELCLHSFCQLTEKSCMLLKQEAAIHVNPLRTVCISFTVGLTFNDRVCLPTGGREMGVIIERNVSQTPPYKARVSSRPDARRRLWMPREGSDWDEHVCDKTTAPSCMQRCIESLLDDRMETFEFYKAALNELLGAFSLETHKLNERLPPKYFTEASYRLAGITRRVQSPMASSDDHQSQKS